MRAKQTLRRRESIRRRSQVGLGAYDFTISWTPIARTNAPPSPDPSGGVTLAAGLAKIGLKLTPQKHSIPVVVIDRLDRLAANN